MNVDAVPTMFSSQQKRHALVVEQQERPGHCRSGVRDRDVEPTVGASAASATAASTCSVTVTSHSAIRTSHPGTSARICVGALFEDFAATGGERDDRAFTRERRRDAAPDAGTAPGDEGVRAAE